MPATYCLSGRMRAKLPSTCLVWIGPGASLSWLFLDAFGQGDRKLNRYASARQAPPLLQLARLILSAREAYCLSFHAYCKSFSRWSWFRLPESPTLSIFTQGSLLSTSVELPFQIWKRRNGESHQMNYWQFRSSCWPNLLPFHRVGAIYGPTQSPWFSKPLEVSWFRSLCSQSDRFFQYTLAIWRILFPLMPVSLTLILRAMILFPLTIWAASLLKASSDCCLFLVVAENSDVEYSWCSSF